MREPEVDAVRRGAVHRVAALAELVHAQGAVQAQGVAARALFVQRRQDPALGVGSQGLCERLQASGVYAVVVGQ